MTPTTTPYGGYAITALREAGGEETPRFEAHITKDGVKVMHVSNDGHGSSHRYQPVSDDYAAFRAAHTEFADYAAEWNRASEFAGIEDADALVYRLMDVAVLNRKRAILFVIDDMDYFEAGVAHQMPAGVTYDGAVAYLGQNYPGRNARVWNKTRSEFVPVD